MTTESSQDPFDVDFEALVPTPPRRFVALSVFFLAVGLLVLSAAVFTSVRQPTPWSPLGKYETQRVLSVIPGRRGPAIAVDGILSVRATKCANEVVTVRGASYWQSVDVPGSYVPAGSGVGLRNQGCVTKTYENPIPPEVVAAVNRVGGPHRWVVAGIETPLRSDGRSEGVPRAWVTEEFEIVPR